MLPATGNNSAAGFGGWVNSVGTGAWLGNGGLYVFDFPFATVGVTGNLSSSTAQCTGFYK